MTREQAREHINSLLPQELTRAKKKVSGYYTYICPFCRNGSGEDGTGISTKNGKNYTCFRGCFSSLDYLDILKKQHGTDKELDIFNHYDLPIDNDPLHSSATTRQNKMLLSETETEPKQPETKDYKNYFIQVAKNLQKSKEGQEYIKRRGISLETAIKFKLGYDPTWRHPKAPTTVPTSSRLIIPTGESSYTARDINPNATDYAKQKVKGREDIDGNPLYNVEALTGTGNPYIFIVEGEIDALSVIEVGGQAVAIGSISNKGKLIQAIKDMPPTMPLVLSLDIDENEAGQKAQAFIKKELEALGIPFLEVNISSKYSDPNEHLQADKDIFATFVKDPLNAEREQLKATYMEENAVVNCLNDFMGDIRESANTPATPTGFTLLDDVLDGGFYEGLYILGALSSLGKTSFCLQIADQIAKSGQDVIIFSLEMSKYELISKSLSRLTIMLDKGKNDKGYYYARTNRQITAGAKWGKYSERETTLIKNAVTAYGNEYASNLFINEGLGDIGAEMIKGIVKEHISFTGSRPLVMIDYLQILQPYDVRATDKANTDKAVLELKRMSRDFKIPVLAISSFNRDNYLSPVNMSSFKESGAIEYSSDVLFGLQFDGMDSLSEYEGTDQRRKNANKAEMLEKIEDWKKAEPRKVQLKILKNRNGATGESIYYDYYPKFNYFTESTNVKGIMVDSNKIAIKRR